MSKSVYFTQHMAHLVEMDGLTSAYIRVKSDSTHQIPAQIIGALVRKKLET
jgi:hypothetical protein